MSNYNSAPYRFDSILWYSCLVICLLTACSPIKKSIKNLDQNPVYQNSFTGFVLYDPVNREILFDHHGSKYFTPASNTKLFTFYVANRILGDSIIAFEYKHEGDSIWLWGTGDPSFLNPVLPESKVFHFLKGKTIFLVRDQYREPVYGPGWAWDDYSGSYQREKASFPIYGNAVYVSKDTLADNAFVTPSMFSDSVVFDMNATERMISSNEFHIDRDWDGTDTLSLPLKISDSLMIKLWSDTLNSQVSWVPFESPIETIPFYSISSDSAFKRMLQISDNFVAEQLILLSSWEIFKELNSEQTIEQLSDSLLSDLTHAPIWVDGSGLSRYNLFTPMTMVELLTRIYHEVEEERIYDLFPAGGQSGTIEDYYLADQPYIYAKTGTLRNNHALSGYLITKSGKRLIFSFMHNHYPTGSHPIKVEMEKLLWQIHLKY